MPAKSISRWLKIENSKCTALIKPGWDIMPAADKLGITTKSTNRLPLNHKPKEPITIRGQSIPAIANLAVRFIKIASTVRQ
jgi:hypothetical protein